MVKYRQIKGRPRMQACSLNAVPKNALLILLRVAMLLLVRSGLFYKWPSELFCRADATLQAVLEYVGTSDTASLVALRVGVIEYTPYILRIFAPTRRAIGCACHGRFDSWLCRVRDLCTLPNFFDNRLDTNTDEMPWHRNSGV